MFFSRQAVGVAFVPSHKLKNALYNNNKKELAWVHRMLGLT